MDQPLFFDLETDREGKRLLAVGALFGQGELHERKLDKLLPWLEQSSLVVGHNIVWHDIPFLKRRLGDGAFEGKVLVDTLCWSALLYTDRPYHKLVKGYTLIAEDTENNPLSDSKLCKQLLEDLLARYAQLDPGQKEVYRALLQNREGYAGFFALAEPNAVVMDRDATEAIRARFDGLICRSADLDAMVRDNPVELAHALALITTTDSGAILPGWVVKTYPNTEELIHQLRFALCEAPDCGMCRDRLDPQKALYSNFGYGSFRMFEGESGMGVQEGSVRAALEGRSLLTVFPTGGGKSLAFQLPALMQGELTRALTVVVSPLVSLMKDQVEVLEDRFQKEEAAHLSGLLSPLERKQVLQRIEQGGIHLLYVAPESLRSPTLTRLLHQRHIARFVIDEAHCFSAWGHDFRVDYLYIAAFIRQLQEDKGLLRSIPVSCFTATAKPQVIEDIRKYFKDQLGLDLEPFISNARRENLEYEVIRLPDPDARSRQRKLLQLVHDCEKPAIVYVSRTKRVDELVGLLKASGISVQGYHGQMKREDKQASQDAFMNDGVEVMVATSAFGMGVDKEDVRTVIHYNISSSLESYVQEAGRAGRSRDIKAKCYILYHEHDLSGHFQMLQRSKLNQREIDQVWRAIKRLTKYRERVSQSARELASAAGWDTEVRDVENKLKAALAALEDRGYVQRTLNSPRVFATGLLTKDLEHALGIVRSSTGLTDKQKEDCARILQRIIKGEVTGVDELAEQLGMPLKQVVATVQLLRELKVLTDNEDLSAVVDIRPRAGSRARFERLAASEKALVPLLPEGSSTISLRALNQGIMDHGVDARVDDVDSLLKYWRRRGFVRSRRVDRQQNLYLIEPRTDPEEILREMTRRHELALYCLDHLLDRAEQRTNDAGSKDEVLVEFSLLKLRDDMSQGLFSQDHDLKAIEKALLFLHECKVLRLEDGFMVLYQRLNVRKRIEDPRKRYTLEDYENLHEHYQNRIEQIHVVGEYAMKRVQSAQSALAFVDDYFRLDHKAFIRKYFPRNRHVSLTRPVTESRFKELVGDLDPVQVEIVKDQADHILVAAGPGSGKTRVLVHKVASLLLLEDVKPEQFLMLTFSKAAALEFRSRIHAMVPEYKGLIRVTTFHGLCFELMGQLGDLDKSETVIDRTIKAIENNEVELSSLANKAVLVLDEFQDVDADQWRLIQTIAKVAESPRIIAVGDDDQNIYAWRGASPEFMAAFRTNFKASTHNLLINYRSKAGIVDLSNHIASGIRNRIKADVQLMAKDLASGQQRVVLHGGGYHLAGLVDQLATTDLPGTTAVLTRTNDEAIMATAMLRHRGIPARYVGGSDDFEVGKLREVRAFTRLLQKQHSGLGQMPRAVWDSVRKEFLERLDGNPHHMDLTDLLDLFEHEFGNRLDLGEWKHLIREIRISDAVKAEHGVVYVSTMHKSKGCEFTNVFLHLDEFKLDTDEQRRLLYVACTRAMECLEVHSNTPFLPEYRSPSLDRKEEAMQHPRPEELSYVLGMRDIDLGSCWYGQDRIKLMRSGEMLEPATKRFNDGDAVGLGKGGTQVLIYSQKFKQNILPRFEQQGYVIAGGQVEYIIEWYDPKRKQVHEVVLPRIDLKRVQST